MQCASSTANKEIRCPAIASRNRSLLNRSGATNSSRNSPLRKRSKTSRYASSPSVESIRADLYAHLTPWQRVQVARHPARPSVLEYVDLLFTEWTEVHGDRPLVQEADGGFRSTYAQAADRVDRWASGVAAGSAPGDRVVLATDNGYEQFLLTLAVARAGRLPAPVNAQMAPSEIDHVVADSGTGELAGLRGRMQIDISDGAHHYRFDYSLPGQ
mgnify:CR=1 FL=1